MCDVPVVGEGEIDNTEYSPSSLPSSSSSKHEQVLELPLRPYKDAEKRTQQVMRSKTIEVVEDCANKFVHYNAKDIPEFVNDLLNCKKWKSTFGSCHNKVDQESIFLTNLAAEYKRCKDKDLSKAVRLRSAKQTQKILIGQTLRDSRICLSGATSEVFKSCVDAAKDLGRIRSYSDGKRRLLSIVATDDSVAVFAINWCIYLGGGGT